MSAAAEGLRITLIERIAAHDRPGAVTAALEALRADALTIPEVYDLLAGLLADVGSAWQLGEAEIWEEHFTTAVVRTIVGACYPLVIAQAAAPVGRTVLLATPSEEYHDLGLRMMADRFTLVGWTAHLLGASVPVEQLSAAVGELGADAVVLSAYTHFHRLALKAYVDDLRSRHPGLRVWVGGAAFAKEHDGWPDETILQPAAVPELAGQVS